MKVNERFRHLFDFLVYINPKYWLMLIPYSKKWDEQLNFLLNNYIFTDIGDYTAKIGGVEVWTANFPYCSFNKYRPEEKCRPSRVTLLRAKRKLGIDEKAATSETDKMAAIADKMNLDIRSTAALALLMQRVYDHKVKPAEAVYQYKNGLHMKTVE